MIKTYNIEVDCAMCANKCEEAISKLDNIKSCNVNFILQKMTLESDNIDNHLLKDVIKTARKIEPDFEILD